MTLLQPATRRARGLRRRGRDRDAHRGRGVARGPRPLPRGRERARRASSPPATAGAAPSRGSARWRSSPTSAAGAAGPGRRRAISASSSSRRAGSGTSRSPTARRSVGCVLHARTVRGREGNLEQLYESLIARCRGLAEALDGAPRITPVHSAANFSYRTDPGDRRPLRLRGRRHRLRGPDLLLRRLHRDPVGRAGLGGDPQGVPGEPLRRPPLPRLRAPHPQGHEALPALHPELLRSLVHRDVPQAARVRGHGGQRHRRAGRRRVPASHASGCGSRSSVFFTIVRINRWVRRRRGLPTESRFEW